MSTLVISIERTSLGLGALVLSAADDGTPLGVTGYTEPAVQPRISYAPDSAYVSGSMPLAITWQQTILGFDVSATEAVTEAESRALIAELRAAVSQRSFTVTVTVDGAPSETWTCHTGSLQATPRTYFDLENHDPVWAVTIPAHPTRQIGA